MPPQLSSAWLQGDLARLASLFLEGTSLSPSSHPKGDDGSQTFPGALLEEDGLNHRAGERLEFMQFGGCWVFVKRFSLCHILSAESRENA